MDLASLAGILVGIALGLWPGELIFAWYLKKKAAPKDRTAAKILDGFYYIVPEHEYNRLYSSWVSHNYKQDLTDPIRSEDQ